MQINRITGSFQLKTTVLAILILALLAQSRAQTFSVIHNFTDSPGGPGYNGGIVVYNGVLYGVTEHGGTNATGSIFKMNPDGSGYRVLKTFSPQEGQYQTNTDGASPYGRLTVSGNMIYGSAYYGGYWGWGTIFSLTTNGDNFTVLKVFTNDLNPRVLEPAQGSDPVSRLVLVGKLLYGTVTGPTGGLFCMNTNGTGFTIITNIIGTAPSGDLILDGDTFYGINYETVYSIKTNGTDYFPIVIWATNNISFPSGITLGGNTVYGECYSGGSGSGMIFRVNTDGSGCEVLRSFGQSDGVWLTSSLVLYSNTLYGATYMEGPQYFGTVYQMNTNGSGFAVIEGFSGNSSGQFPEGDIALSGHTLYGFTLQGGTNNEGVVYSMDVTPIVAHISYSKHMLDLKWNTLSNHVYQLQFTTNLNSGWLNLGSSVTAKSNSISTTMAPGGGMQQFYRINLVQ